MKMWLHTKIGKHFLYYIFFNSNSFFLILIFIIIFFPTSRALKVEKFKINEKKIDGKIMHAMEKQNNNIKKEIV